MMVMTSTLMKGQYGSPLDGHQILDPTVGLQSRLSWGLGKIMRTSLVLLPPFLMS